MARKFSSFLDAYFEYVRDGYAPDAFHRWVGISILAAALERKVSLPQGQIHHTPNMYVMLVSPPGIGKSTAIDAGMHIIEQLKERHNPNFRIIPNQVTEPAFIDLMKIVDNIPIEGTTRFLRQSAGFFCASEASASALQNTCGDFIASMTRLYDCPRVFDKKLKGESEPTIITNGCMNMLAGSTFNYLKTLVNEQSVLGGFASRLIYVVHDERKVVPMRWGASQELNLNIQSDLIDELAHINTLMGRVTATRSYQERWEEWKPKHDKYLFELGSERLEAIMTRKGTNTIKLSMLLAVSEGDKLEVTGDHFDRALRMIEDVYKDNPRVIAAAAIADVNSQRGLTQLILHAADKTGGRITYSDILSAVMANGNDVAKIAGTLESMKSAEWLLYDNGVYTVTDKAKGKL